MDVRGTEPSTLEPKRDEPSGPGRHARGPTLSPSRAAWRLLARGRLVHVPLLLSDQARMILERKYDAFTTDRAYENRPHGRLGPVGWAADALVLRFPVHRTLRRRLAIVEDSLVEAGMHAAAAGADPVRILSAPCGLARDVIAAARRLTMVPRLHVVGVDLDERGDVLPEAHRRARAGGVEIELLREDLFTTTDSLTERIAPSGGFDVVSCVGLCSWLDIDEVRELIARFRELTGPGSVLIIDSWRPDRHARLARELGLPSHYHDPGAFALALELGGFTVDERRSTRRGECIVWIARRRS